MVSYKIHIGKLIIGNGNNLTDIKIGIKNGIIKELTEYNLKNKYKKEIDCSDYIAMPGLIDAHSHLASVGSLTPETTVEYLTLKSIILAKKSLYSGVTTLGDAGAVGNSVFALRQAINEKMIQAPRIKACGGMITMTGGRVVKGKKPGSSPYEVDGEDEARRIARTLLMYKGADFLKLGATGSMSNPLTGPTHPQLNINEMRAVTEEAHKCNKMVHAHCYGELGINNSLEAEVDVIVHGQSFSKQQIMEMKKKGTIFIPTLSAYQKYLIKYEAEEGKSVFNQSTQELIRQTEPNFKNALKNDLTIALGTDTSSRFENSFGKHAEELVHMVNYGMSEEKAIVVGTLNTAKALGVDKKIGTLEEGKNADLLILREDPTKDIKILSQKEKIFTIILDGEKIY
ncbi:amidohydrolase family protein [Thermoproteota archaeon]